MDQETLDFLAELERSDQNRQPNEDVVPTGQRECPICKKKVLVEVESGISIDICQEHGVWLDRGELPGIISRIRSGERVDRIQAIRRAKREGKMSGTIFGVWSLLFD
jgi:Zn-finger nucleic acid-binding protein